MIVMDLKLDNFKAFRNFHLNMSYPKKGCSFDDRG